MPCYEYLCRHCGNRFERRNPVWLRDEMEVCDQCGNGAERVFSPAMVNIPPGWSGMPTSAMSLSVEECRAREKAFDALPSQPARPSFEDCLKGELDARGIRHPNHLVDAKAGFDKTCL